MNMNTLSEKNDITVKIMDRDINVKCPVDKIDDLHKAAKFLDRKIYDLYSADNNKKVTSTDNLLVITALNITYELLTQKKQNNLYIDNMKQQINNIQNIIEQALVEEN